MADAAEKLTFRDTFQTYVARYPPPKKLRCVYGPEERQADKVEKRNRSH